MAATEMDATATATAATTTTVAAGGPPPAIPEKYMHKNRLQSLAERTHKKLPVYKVDFEGEYHNPKFRCTVEVGGHKFLSTGSFSRKKEAEQDAARVAYEILATIGEGDVKEACGLIEQRGQWRIGVSDVHTCSYCREKLKYSVGEDRKMDRCMVLDPGADITVYRQYPIVHELVGEDAVFCKSILYEFAVKTKTPLPSYSVVRLGNPLTMFGASVVFDGKTYAGEPASNKKDAEQSAARAVIESILATDNNCMIEIIRSKKPLITATRSFESTPTTFTPIKFTRPVAYAAYGGADHVAPMSQDESSSLDVQGLNIVPTVGTSANPSLKAVTGSKKRKATMVGKEH